MAEIKIYTTQLCGFCYIAKTILENKGAAFEEIDVSFSPDLREQMRLEAGGVNTVPQIFIDGAHIGGCNDLRALDESGKLDEMLNLART